MYITNVKNTKAVMFRFLSAPQKSCFIISCTIFLRFSTYCSSSSQQGDNVFFTGSNGEHDS